MTKSDLEKILKSKINKSYKNKVKIKSGSTHARICASQLIFWGGGAINAQGGASLTCQNWGEVFLTHKIWGNPFQVTKYYVQPFPPSGCF